ncbi:regulator [Streptomyces sp. NPDC091280]|uniref:regulator n=1 Tax=Streptomyces sp. NPDC091280 TaxID=3365984 RepID=UPI0037F7A39B
MTILSTSGVEHACTVLSSPALIRLITEIDDNGPVPPRALRRTVPDVPGVHLRRDTGRARLLGLVHVQPGAGLALTVSGGELAGVYDELARWARRHAYPAPVCDFTGRIQHTLALLTGPPLRSSQSGHRRCADGPAGGVEDGADIARLRRLLEEWLHDNPLVAGVADTGIAA